MSISWLDTPRVGGYGRQLPRSGYIGDRAMYGKFLQKTREAVICDNWINVFNNISLV